MIGEKGIFSLGDMKNVQITIGEVVGEEAEWEPLGPTPKPTLISLRNWDHKLFRRYPPLYAPGVETCEYCSMGPCNLSGNREGACGIDLEAHQGRLVLQSVLQGCAAHSAHGRHMVSHLIQRYGPDHPLKASDSRIQMPVTATVTGTLPKTLGELPAVLDYLEEQVVHMLSSTHTGMEGASVDFESKALHGGMMDQLGMEVADVAQISCLGMPTAAGTGLVDVGMGAVDAGKPVLITIGHNVAAAYDVIRYMEANGLYDEIELCGLCCTAHDMARVDGKTKIVGPLAKELKYIRSGVPDVAIVDEQCVRSDVLKECRRLSIPVIVTNEKILYGLRDRTRDPASEIMEDLASGKEPGAIILDYEKLAEVVVPLVRRMHKLRREKGITAMPSAEQFKGLVESCSDCGHCVRACPTNLPIPQAMQAAKAGDTGGLAALHDRCIGCGRCEFACSKQIPILNVIEKASAELIRKEAGKVRIGRGQISDAEIRTEAINLVMGTTPGAVAFVGCSNYPDGTRDVYDMVSELASRRYIILMSGCAAMDLGMYRDADGKTIYETHPDTFEGGGVINLGSCVSNSHIVGTLIKVPSIFAKRNIRANWEEIADYNLHRTGAVGVAWGAYSQKATSIAAGVFRVGTPVVCGPHAAKYKRTFIGDKHDPEKWRVLDGRDGSTWQIEPAPEHLFITAENKNEALPLIAKLCMRPSDNNKGRQIKLTHYIDLSQKYLGRIPDDFHLYVRSETELPLTLKEELLHLLEDRHGWKVDWAKGKILEGPLRKADVGFSPTTIPELCKGGRGGAK